MTEKINRSLIIFTVFIVLLSILLFFSIVSPVHRWGDASTYYMQISSIVNDHDIQYQPIDLQRALQTKFDDLPAGLILIRTATGTYFYGKEFSYALFTAPFFALLGIQGILVFNALMFWSMILMGFWYLREKGNSDIVAFGTSFIFFTVSTAFVYIFWVHPEIYNMFLLTLALFLWIHSIEKPGSEKFLLCSAFIFGLATVSRIPNGLLFLPFLFYEFYSRRFKRALSLFILFLIPLLLFYGYFFSVSGVASFYGGNQSGYSSNYPFMSSSSGEVNNSLIIHDGDQSGYSSNYPFISSSSGEVNNSLIIHDGDQSGYSSNYPFISSSSGEVNNSLIIHEEIDPVRSLFENSVIEQGWGHLQSINYLNGLYNGFYFFFGRFTGLIWYYPLAAFALTSFLIVGIISKMRRRKNDNPFLEVMENPTHYLVFVGIILNILFFIFLNGNNYFGGQHAVGNRYFWVYPAFLFLIRRVNLKLIIPFILIALVTVVPIISDPVSNSQSPQRHTFIPPYPLFPFEYNQVRNLPLWSPQPPALQDISFLYKDSEGGIPRYLGSNTYSISGTSHWIVQKYGTIDHVTMIFRDARKEASNVLVISGNYTKTMEINFTNPVKITIPLQQPEYYGNPPLNEISVRTTSEIIMTVVSDETENQVILYSGGWYDEEKNNNQSFRWMTDQSTLVVYSDYEQNKSIQFDAISFSRPNHLNLQVDGNNYIYDINPENYSTITSPLHLHAGYTIVQYNVPEGCISPSDNSGLNTGDTRCLSLNVRNMSLIEPLPSKNESEKHGILYWYSYGWFEEEKDNNQSWRWMTDQSTLVVYSDYEQNKTIQFDGSSFGYPRDLTLRGDGYYQVFRLYPKNYTSITSPIHLKAGYTFLQFDVPAGCTRLSDVSDITGLIIGWKTGDTRCLSIRVRNMTIS